MGDVLGQHTIRLVRPACDHSMTHVNAIVEFQNDISELLPYVNATVQGCRYTPELPALRFTHEGHVITLHSRHLTITRLEDASAAREVLDWLAGFLAGVEASRDALEPNFSRGTELTALDVFKMLPRTNCKACGEPTCMAFAAKVASGYARESDCPALRVDPPAPDREAPDK